MESRKLLSCEITFFIKVQNLINSNHQLPFFFLALDTSVLAAIQHLAQQNRHQVAALQAEVNILKKLQKTSPPAPAHVDSDKPQVNSNGDNTMFENLHNHLMTLQEEQVNLAGQLTNMLDDTKDEFNRKQVCLKDINP